MRQCRATARHGCSSRRTLNPPNQAARRTAQARKLCLACPHTERCRQLAGPVDDRGVSRWTGIWAGEVRLNADDMRRTRRDAKRRAAS